MSCTRYDIAPEIGRYPGAPFRRNLPLCRTACVYLSMTRYIVVALRFIPSGRGQVMPNVDKHGVPQAISLGHSAVDGGVPNQPYIASQ